MGCEARARPERALGFDELRDMVAAARQTGQRSGWEFLAASCPGRRMAGILCRDQFADPSRHRQCLLIPEAKLVRANVEEDLRDP
jgi:hypothetical protein